MARTGQALYRIHGVDNISSFTIDCYSDNEYNNMMAWCRENPEVDGVWTEYWDQEEGWQA